jgi:hypothetical protein
MSFAGGLKTIVMAADLVGRSRAAVASVHVLAERFHRLPQAYCARASAAVLLNSSAIMLELFGVPVWCVPSEPGTAGAESGACMPVGAY